MLIQFFSYVVLHLYAQNWVLLVLQYSLDGAVHGTVPTILWREFVVLVLVVDARDKAPAAETLSWVSSLPSVSLSLERERALCTYK